MKRLYIICFFCVCAALGAYFTYNYFSNDNKNNEEKTEYTDFLNYEIVEIPIDNLSDESIKINNLTVVKMQKFYETENEFSEETISTPVIYLEMTKQDMLTYLAGYMAQPSREDVDEGIVSFEIVEFTAREVVLRKTYRRTAKDEVKYYGCIENGYVCIYMEDGRTIYDYTDISSNKLPLNIKEQLSEGMKFYGIDELYEFLETYSS
jgi:hypothetical protein